MQFKSPTGRALYRSQFDVFRKTIAKQGVAGLYQGVESQLLKGFFSEGVKLLVKDRCVSADCSSVGAVRMTVLTYRRTTRTVSSFSSSSRTDYSFGRARFRHRHLSPFRLPLRPLYLSSRVLSVASLDPLFVRTCVRRRSSCLRRSDRRVAPPPPLLFVQLSLTRSRLTVHSSRH